jgi:prevent-host-death family protein
MKTKKMTADTFKKKCLTVIDEVQASGEPVLITKKGKPIVKLVPVPVLKDDIFGFLEGKGKIVGDIVGPILTPEEWGNLY